MNVKKINSLKKNIDLHIFILYENENYLNKLKKIDFTDNYKKLSKDFTGKYNQFVKLYTKKSRIFLVGVGNKDKLNKIKIRKCLSKISHSINNIEGNNIMLHPYDDFLDTQVEAITMNNYSFNKYKTKNK